MSCASQVAKPSSLISNVAPKPLVGGLFLELLPELPILVAIAPPALTASFTISSPIFSRRQLPEQYGDTRKRSELLLEPRVLPLERSTADASMEIRTSLDEAFVVDEVNL